MNAIEIKKDIHWVGALDPSLRIFDIIMYTPYGTTYNSYLVKGSEKTAIFETVKEKFFDEFLERLNSLNTDIKDIDYIVVDHTEPDHAGSVAKLLNLAPKAKLVGSSTALRFMRGIINREFDSITVNHGDTLSLGNKTLQFISAPFLHWPDSMYTYIVEDNLLVTCDSFGSHYSNKDIFNDLNESQENYMDALKYYFTAIMGPFKSYVLDAIDKIKDLNIDIICPGHGPVLRDNPSKIIKLYKEWSLDSEKPSESKHIVIPYVSAYGYTESLAKKIEEGIHSIGEFKVELFDVIHHNINDIVSSIEKSHGVIFGSPTINGDALKPILDILIWLNPIVHGRKSPAAFGSYGWSGEAVSNIENRLKQLKMDVFSPGLRVNFKPSEEDLTHAYHFGQSFAQKIDENISKVNKPNKPSTSKKWKCLICGVVFEGTEPPETCSVCGASSEQFVEVVESGIEFRNDDDKTYLIIGNGAAGFSAADTIRKRNKNCKIIMVSSENNLTYFRPQLSDYLSSSIPDN
ncbi:MAG: MBL fold metallo-hydrolase, partial [Clostridiaceae bacterium]|nr:MBL fold metallo-hydrolase [Clostridiaceae bacterium]